MIRDLTNARDWLIWDSERGTLDGALRPHATESSPLTGNATKIDLVSNGFKLKTNYTNMNASADHLYLAFAEHPFKTARAR